ncbi:hypothetical protein ACFQ07_31320, partial [Actinomadura adrarensis]
MQALIFHLSAPTEEADANAFRPPAGAEFAAALPEELHELSDDELLAVAADARRVASWAQARELAAISVLHRRRL